MKRVFISFDYDNDSNLKVLLVGQAKNPDSPFEIADWSVKEPFTGDWKEKVKDKMNKVDVVIVLCGQSTDTASGVNAEVEIAQELNKPYFLLSGTNNSKKPRKAKSNDKLYEWTWEHLKTLIEGNR